MIVIRFIILFAAVIFLSGSEMRAQDNLRVERTNGLQMVVVKENTEPALRIILPGAQPSDSSVEILFPEHVTVRKHGHSEAEHLYIFRPGDQGERPTWRCTDNSLEYERYFRDSLHMLARATLEEYGVRIAYIFTDRSAVEYDLVYAVTDPRLSSMFNDVRLERTYVHHPDGFELLASETPERLTMPLDKWLPCRYLVSYTWPVPAALIRQGADGITYYNKSRAVDSPFIATLSKDRQWVVASFTSQSDKVGNVWSNPQLTCQHVDPQSALMPGKQIKMEVSILIIRGSVEDAFSIATRQLHIGR